MPVGKKVSEGICFFCKQTFNKAVITKHLQSCEKRKSPTKTTPVYHLLIQNRYAPEYWLHIEIQAKATLKTLDNFLRNIWLECCGHLSGFRFGEIMYMSHPDKSYGDKGMNIILAKLIDVGTTFTHEYDFGTTTELILKVLSKYGGEDQPSVKILARNNPPFFLCCQCKNKATQTCCECGWNTSNCHYCDNCAKKHKHEEMFLPIVNSPRSGVCGYVG